MKKEKWLLLITMLVVHTLSVAQNVGGNVEDGGTSGSVKAGNNLFNVDQYTGTGSAQVSIYDFGLDNLGLGVSINYNAKGNRVNDMSSPIGLGWSLNAGGVISREVRGIEDEITMPTRFYTHLGWQYSWGYVATPPGACSNQTCFNYNDTLQGILVPDALAPDEVPDQGSVSRYKVYDDQEADLFHFSLGSRSFSFAFKKTSSGLVYYTYPKTEVKIDVITQDYISGVYTNDRPGIPKSSGLDSIYNLITFVITDESGNKFYFKRGDYQVKEFHLDTFAFLPCNGVYYATQNWIIDKVVTYTGQEIKYHYVKKYMEYLESITETIDTEPLTFNTAGDTVLTNPLKIKYQYWKGYKHHISQIDYPDAVNVFFELDHSSTDGRCDCNGDFRLKSITAQTEVDNGNKNSIKFRFNQSYFNTPAYSLTTKEINNLSCSLIQSLYLTSGNGFNNQAAKDLHKERGLRLKLNSIDKIGTNGTTTERMYTFGYNETALPYRFAPGQDYYGFSNGDVPVPFQWLQYDQDSFGHDDSLYYLTIPYDSYRGWGADRSYNLSHAQSFVLNKITNRFGGKDSIIYINYTLTNPSCSYGDINFPPYLGCSIDGSLEGDDVNDGLVVGKIISSDKYSADMKITTEFTYSGGERFFRGGYMRYPDAFTGGTAYTNYFLDPHNTINGSNHGFDEVTVCSYGYNNERLSKVKSTFSNLMYQGVSSLTKLTGSQFQTLNATMRKYRMGVPLKTESYDELDNLTSVSESVYEVRSLADSIFNRSIYYVPAPPPNASNPVHCWTDNGVFNYLLLDYQWMRMKEHTVKRYVKGPGVTVAKEMVTTYLYKYDKDENVVVITWWDSKGDTFKKIRYYNDDYFTQFPTHTALDLMHQKNMQFLLSSEIWKMKGNDSDLLRYELLVPGFDGTQTKLRFPANFTTTLDQPLTSAQVFPAIGTSTYIDRGAALNYTSNTSYGSHLEKGWEATRYDGRNNILETKVNDQDMYESFIFDSKFQNKIAEVKNARYDDIAYSGFESTYTGAGWQDGNIWFDPAYIIYTPGSTPCPNAATGKYVFELTQTSNSNTNYLQSKTLSAKTYILSFWTYTPAPGSVLQAELFNGSTNLGTISTTVINQVGNWKLNIGTVTASSGNHIRIKNYLGTTGGHSVFIDEVRLYPVDATMSTIAYKPFFGRGSTCSANNYIEHFEYDVFGKVTIVRDMRGNIVTKIESAEDNSDAYNATPHNNYSTY